MFEIGGAGMGVGFEVFDVLAVGDGRCDEGDADAEAGAEVFGERRAQIVVGGGERADAFDEYFFDAMVGGLAGDLSEMIEQRCAIERFAVNGRVYIIGALLEY